MKKALSLLISCLLVFSFLIEAGAFQIYFQKADAPKITASSENGENLSKTYSFSYSSSLKDTELLRETICSLTADRYASFEEFLSSSYGWLAQSTKNYCEISTDGKNWCFVKEISNNSFNLSFGGEILPVLSQKIDNLHEKTEGFTLFVRVLTASENYALENTENVFCYVFSESVSVLTPPFGYIRYILPESVTNPKENLTFFAQPLENDIILSSPEKEGYVFDGWAKPDGKRVGKIEKGTVFETLTAHFLPLNYEINYVLTTNINYPFGRADNTKNPVSYESGTAVSLYDINSPVIGYLFDGWYTTEDFSGERVTEIKAGSTGDILLYAKWISIEEKRWNFIKENKYGDIDSDGKISASDARSILRAVVGLEKYPDSVMKRADYYNTGKITSDNARTTLRIAVGLESIYDILLENGVLT